jgi:hypothetical protein
MGNANDALCGSNPVISGSGRAGAWDARCSRAAESAQADFVYFQRRIHSLLGRTARLPTQIRKEHNSPQQPHEVHLRGLDDLE